MLERLQDLEQEALAALESIEEEESLQAWKVKYLGRSAALAEITSGLRDLSAEERPAAGQRANEVKMALEAAYEIGEIGTVRGYYYRLDYDMRVALTGRTASPSLTDVMALLGKDESLNRLSQALDYINQSKPAVLSNM